MRKSRALFVVLGMSFLLFGSIFSQSVYASSVEIERKVLLHALPLCYGDNYTLKDVDGTTSNTNEVQSIFTKEGKRNDAKTIRVPGKKFSNTLSQDPPTISCEQAFAGYSPVLNEGSIDGLLKLYNKSFDIDKMGYEIDPNSVVSGGRSCIEAEYAVSNGQTSANVPIEPICFNVDNGNRVILPSTKGAISIDMKDYRKSGVTSASYANSSYYWTLDYPAVDTLELKLQTTDINIPIITTVNVTDQQTTMEQIKNRIAGSVDKVDIVSETGNSNSGKVGLWEKENDAALATLRYLTDDNSLTFNKVTFSEQEKFDLVKHYVEKVIQENDEVYIDTSSCFDEKTGLGTEKGVFFNGKWCIVRGADKEDGRFNVIKNTIQGNAQALIDVDFDSLLTRYMAFDESVVNMGNGVNANNINNSGVEEDNCRNAGGAGALAWAICPILTIMSDAAEGIYTDVVGPLLVIEPTLFGNAKGGKDTRDAWETFRDIANVLFIILFLVVIFSQLTGIGIDNYGIKKILPRLIVAAVLINLSYLICLLLVDLSNILGVGLKGIFDTLGEKLNTTINLPSGVTTSGGGTTFSLGQIFASVGIAGIVGVLVGVAVWSNPAIVLSMLVSVLGLFIAMLFLFLLLGARKALIIILTVISPLAVVAYMLPNTKKLFERWWKLLEGLLLVYPIAGLMIGAGNYTSKLLLQSADGFFMWIIAMVVGIAPIFFIPIVLKGAFSAMGKVGGMLAGMGDSASKGITGLARNSERFQTAQRMGKERNNRIKAGLDKNGVLTGRGQRRLKRLNRLSRVPVVRGLAGGMTKRQASLMAQARKDIDASEDAAATLSGALATSGIGKSKAISDLGFEAGTESAYYGGQFLEAASKGNITAMNAAIEAMRRSNMKPKDIARVIRKAENDGSIKLNDENKAAWARDMSKKYGGDFLSTDYELSHFLRTGAKGNGGVLGDYGTYASAAIKNEDINPEELMRLSGDSLAGMAAAGKISQEMAQRVLASNPNLSDDKKIMFGALADGSASEASIGGIHNYKKFKDDASNLANNRNDTAGVSTISGSNLPAKVSEWTRPTTQKVEVVNAGGLPTPGGPGGGSS